MILTICMAGLNTRFHDVGFDLPKYLLPWKDRTVIHAVIAELTAFNQFERVILLPNRRDRSFRTRLLETLEGLPVAADDIAYIPDTKGQAHTAAIGAQIAADRSGSGDRPIAFHNADTILQNRHFDGVFAKLATMDAFIDVFPASSPRYSYVSLEASGLVTRVAEKKVISPFASSGFYAFRSTDLYLKAFNRLHEERAHAGEGEIYLSDVLDAMIRDGGKVFVNDLTGETGTIVLGTPEEYGIELAKSLVGR